MAAAQGHLDVAGSRLEYRRIEARCEGPEIVLLHEGLGCVAMWQDFPERLAAATGLGVLSYSRPGYGGSDRAKLPRPVSYMHREAQLVLPALLQAAGVERAVLLGHSDGASIALIYASGEQPVPAEALVLMAPHVFVESLCLAAIASMGERYRREDMRGRLAHYHGAQVDQTFWGWHDVWLDAEFETWNIVPLLYMIGAPMLLLQAERDPYGSLAQIEAIERNSGGSTERRILSGTGHAPHRDHPDSVTTWIAQSLARWQLLVRGVEQSEK